MKKSEQASRVQAISAYLNGISHNVTNVQCYEILARALGLKNKHVLASLAKESVALPAASSSPAVLTSVTRDGRTIAVMALDAQPYTVAQLQAMNWTFDVVVPMPLDDLQENGIDYQNELASKFITGNEYALESISYEHVPEVNYGVGYAAYRVSACISDPSEVFEEIAAEDDAKFYHGLTVLASQLENGKPVMLKVGEEPPEAYIVDDINFSILALFKAYADNSGANNAVMNEMTGAAVMTLRKAIRSVHDIGLRVELGDLKYATQLNDLEWHISMYQTSTKLSFNV